MKYIIGLVAMLLPMLSGAQSPPVKVLSIGDTVPDIELNNIINYKDSTAKLSDFKGKLVILDFWSSWCSSCISLFPHMDSLQRRFKNNLQVILVNTKSAMSKDDAPKINKILSRVKERTGNAIDLPVVYNSPELDNYFPCRIIPHEVWINNRGKVVAITYADEVIPANIQAMINGDNVHLRLKQDRFDLDVRKPLFINGNGGDGDETLYRTLLTRNLDGAGGATGIREEDGKITGVYSINQSLFALTKMAYSRDIPFVNNRVVFDVKNKESFIAADTDTAAYNYQYSYEVIAPPTNDTSLLRNMQNDLKRYFNISIKREKREMKCLVLTARGLTSATIDKRADFDLQKSTAKKYIYNYSPDQVVRILNLYSSIPVINEIHTNTKVSIDLPFNISDTRQLRDAFAKAGIVLTEEKREIEVIVVTDK